MEIEVGSRWINKLNQLYIVQVKEILEWPASRRILFTRGGDPDHSRANYTIESFLKHYRPMNRLEKVVLFGEA